VIHANLRPPAENQSKQTNGRKSNKRAKAAAAAAKGEMELDDGEPLTELEDDDPSGVTIAADPDTKEGFLAADAIVGIASEPISPEVAALAAQQAAMLGLPMPAGVESVPKTLTPKARSKRKQSTAIVQDTQSTPVVPAKKTRAKRQKVTTE